MNDLTKYVELAVEDCATYMPLAVRKRKTETVEEKAINYLFDQYDAGIKVTDEMLCEHIYKHRNTKNSTFNNLKVRITEKLQNNLLFYEYSENDKGRLLIEAQKLHLKALGALKSGFDKEAKDLLLKCIAICEKCEQYGIATQACSCLADLSTRTERMSVVKYIRDMEKYADLEHLRQRARAKHALFLHYIRNSKNKVKVISSLDKFIEETQEKWEASKLSNAWWIYIRLSAIKAENFADTVTIIELMQRTRKMLASGALKKDVVDIRYTYYTESLACLMERDVSTGLKSVRAGLQEFEKYKKNWYVMQMHHLLLLFHARKYEEAADVIDEVMSRKVAFNSQFRLSVERTRLFKEYLRILLPNRWRGGIDYDKFYRDQKELRQDKKGLNFWLLLLEIFWCAQEGKWDRMDRRVTALIAYKNRWTKSKRIHAFVYLLAYVAQHNYNPKKTPKRAVLEKIEFLNSSSLSPMSQAYPDILPLEDAYELFISILVRKRKQITIESVVSKQDLREQAIAEYQSFSKL
ncbi:MAG: hypothetical protein ACFB0B_20710 [Thermonemataceae bacterium]